MGFSFKTTSLETWIDGTKDLHNGQGWPELLAHFTSARTKGKRKGIPNYAEIARDFGVSRMTAKRWFYQYLADKGMEPIKQARHTPPPRDWV